MKMYRLACFYREEEYFATSGETLEGCCIHPKSSEGVYGLENPESLGAGELTYALEFEGYRDHAPRKS